MVLDAPILTRLDHSSIRSCIPKVSKQAFYLAAQINRPDGTFNLVSLLRDN
jgi:hypothetical protein